MKMCADQGPANDWSQDVYNTLVAHFSKPLAGIVANYDYDGILCAAMLKQAFPKSHIFGFYDLKRIARMPIATWKMLGEAIWRIHEESSVSSMFR